MNINHIKNSLNKFPCRDLNIFIASWNIFGIDLPENFDFIPLLFPNENKNIPDMFILGFQEIINLSPKNLILSSNSNTEKIENLRKILIKNLNILGKYTIVKTSNLVGIYMIIFIKENLCEYISKIESCTIKTGLMGTLGNKGNCIIRFNFQDVSFAFSCCHLKSGENELNSRILEISEILNKNIKLKDSKEMMIKDHDIFFIFGDLNFRLDIDMKKYLDLINNQNLKELLKYDQFNKNKNTTNKDLKLLSELDINFNPTYKYQIGTNEYYIKEKYIPSWCDRIIFNKNMKIKGIYYTSVENYKESDHKPIFGIYKIKINDNDKISISINNNNNPNFISNSYSNQNDDINNKIGKFIPQNHYVIENNIGNNTLNLENFEI
jgi:hypothetical protein